MERTRNIHTGELLELLAGDLFNLIVEESKAPRVKRAVKILFAELVKARGA